MRLNKDSWYMAMADVVAKRSACLSRQIGAVIIKDDVVAGVGYNGPVRGMLHCSERCSKCGRYFDATHMFDKCTECYETLSHLKECPRKLMGFQSGDGLEHCPSAHAEFNAIINAGRAGVSVLGASMFMNTLHPCKNCAVAIVQSGISRVVCKADLPYESKGIGGREILDAARVRLSLYEEGGPDYA